jgi:hypothetical protein
MPGFMPGIHVLFFLRWQDLDGRDKPGHDAGWSLSAFTRVLESLWRHPGFFRIEVFAGVRPEMILRRRMRINVIVLPRGVPRWRC